MEPKSRTEYSAMNTTVAITSHMVTFFVGYLVRMVFTHLLSESYVGVNGLFLDIINVLSFTELGIGTAISYALYKPISEGDKERQKSLMRLYRNFYRFVALIILAAGLLLVPFLDYLIKNETEVQNLTLIYLMYLASSVLSYTFIYKKALIDAHQKMYIGLLYQNGFLLIQYAIQVVILLTTKSFVLYLSVQIIKTITCNIAITRHANKLYPFLKEQNVVPLSKSERKSITQNIRAMLMHKLGGTVVNNTDNLLLSSIVGIISVACYSNYYLVIASVQMVLRQMFQGITASVGNLGVNEDSRRIRRIFEAIFFMDQWIYGFAAICLYELLSSFVGISFGEQYIFDPMIVLILCVNFYVNGMRQATLVFRDSLGLFWYDRYKSVFEAAINLIVSILLARKLGTAGVFLGTFVSTMTTSAWVEPLVLYRVRLKHTPWSYYGKYILYTAILLAAAALTNYCCNLIQAEGWRLLLLRLPICVVVPNVVLLACYFRTKEFRLLMEKGIQLIQKKTQRKV